MVARAVRCQCGSGCSHHHINNNNNSSKIKYNNNNKIKTKHKKIVDDDFNSLLFIHHCLSCIAFALPVCTAQHCLLVVLSFQTFALPKCLLSTAVWIFYWKVEYIVILCSYMESTETDIWKTYAKEPGRGNRR